MRFLILTLFSGENEFESCVRSVNSQGYTNHEQRVFENLANAEAHALLYETVMSERENYDLFLKLDADMVFADDDVLERVAEIFQRTPDLDHLVLGVEDWFTDTDVIGVHIFSRRVRWNPNPSGLFTDPDPVAPGRKIIMPHPRPIAVRHGSDPTAFQSFFFGVHRAMKACQIHLDSAEKHPFGARVDWQTLDRLWRHYKKSCDRRLLLAVYGADQLFHGCLPASSVDRGDSELQKAFRRAEDLDDAEIEASLEPSWGRWIPRHLGWLRAMGLGMSLKVGVRLVRDALTSPVRIIRRLFNHRFERMWTANRP